MDPYLFLTKLAFIAALVAVSAFFSGSEAALFSLSPLKLGRLKAAGHPKANLIERLLRQPRRLLITLLMGNEVSDIAAAALASSLAVSLLGDWGKWVAICVMVPVGLLLGEVTPKSIALREPTRFGAAVAKPLEAVIWLTAPARWAIYSLLRFIPSKTDPEQAILEEEFLKWVDSSHKEGLVDRMERDFIANVIAFEKTTVAEVMTPKGDMFTLQADLKLEEAKAIIREMHFSRIPVYDKDPNDIIGILFAKSLLYLKPPQTIRSVLRCAYFFPETMLAECLLAEMQKRRIHLAIVVDKGGNMAGLVTMEDLLEELFGEIYDEHEWAQQKLNKKAEGLYLVSPRLQVAEFNQLMGTDIPLDRGYRSMGGFVSTHLGRRPAVGEQVHHGGFTFSPTRIRGTKILEIEVRQGAQ